MKIKLPHLLSLDITLGDNLIRQISEPSHYIDADLANFTSPTLKGKVIVPKESDRILLLEKLQQADGFTKIIITPKNQSFEIVDTKLKLSHCHWKKHPKIFDKEHDYKKLTLGIIQSWENSFSFIKENVEKKIDGLRSPQIGAIHAVNAHWSVTNEPATIVMPTGTGKTETMLSILVSTLCQKVLVVVPTDALRTQIANKFLTLGVLKGFGVISSTALFPIIGVLKNVPKTIEEVDAIFEKCNVVITTSQIVGQATKEVQKRIAFYCCELFIDEAHHVSAPTWKSFKDLFDGKRILQFTATPFRDDDKPVEGKIIYKYPLSKAQKEGYFSKINFKPVRAFSPKKRDETIADLAVAQLQEDRKKYNHILMARVNTIERAKKVFALYQRKYPEFNPVQIHTGIKSKKERDEIKGKILAGESKIVVCVDMLGEGFDFPELKIAAFHDIRQSPTITIQLAGRFTRPRSDLGEATFIANTGDEDVRKELKKLYNQDPDWNLILPELSEELIQEHLNLNEFAEGFNNFPKEIPIQSLNPALSTVIYKTKCDNWNPENFAEGIQGYYSFQERFHDINREGDTLVIITGQKLPVEWTKIEKIFDWVWCLYVVHWDKEQKLLFINNSSNSGEFKRLAQSVAGDDVELVKGEGIFRCFGYMNRIVFKNVGLNEHLGKLVSYTGRMGSDVERFLSELQKAKSSKSVLFGTGFENGEKTSIGCSAKGRIWSHGRSFKLHNLIKWCSFIGKKILDEKIDPNEFLKNTLVSVFVSERPKSMPFFIDWNSEIYKYPETSVTFVFDDETEYDLWETDIRLVNPSVDGDLEFEIFTEEANAKFVLNLKGNEDETDYEVLGKSEKQVFVRFGKSEVSAEQFFYDYPPVIWFIDGSDLRGDKHTSPNKNLVPYQKEKIITWNWTGTNIRKESQGLGKDSTTIQYRTIQELKKRDFDIIFDDDSSGEAADIVAVKVMDEGENKFISVELYHCKFSKRDFVGARVEDLYEVCGQTQRSVHWMEKPTELFIHLLRREEKRVDEKGISRIDEVGDTDKLHEIKEMSKLYRTEMKIFAVQPGVSKKAVSQSQLELLSVTENFLKETYLIPFTFICSE